jgi:hypothetical protein
VTALPPYHRDLGVKAGRPSATVAPLHRPRWVTRALKRYIGLLKTPVVATGSLFVPRFPPLSPSQDMQNYINPPPPPTATLPPPPQQTHYGAATPSPVQPQSGSSAGHPVNLPSPASQSQGQGQGKKEGARSAMACQLCVSHLSLQEPAFLARIGEYHHLRMQSGCLGRLLGFCPAPLVSAGERARYVFLVVHGCALFRGIAGRS